MKNYKISENENFSGWVIKDATDNNYGNYKSAYKALKDAKWRLFYDRFSEASLGERISFFTALFSLLWGIILFFAYTYEKKYLSFYNANILGVEIDLMNLIFYGITNAIGIILIIFSFGQWFYNPEEEQILIKFLRFVGNFLISFTICYLGVFISFDFLSSETLISKICLIITAIFVIPLYLLHFFYLLANIFENCRKKRIKENIIKNFTISRSFLNSICLLVIFIASIMLYIFISQSAIDAAKNAKEYKILNDSDMLYAVYYESKSQYYTCIAHEDLSQNALHLDLNNTVVFDKNGLLVQRKWFKEIYTKFEKINVSQEGL